ncbi:MAG: 4a-hydroxytetrahydrobiopterin dehydratase [Rickettsiales bacterium]|nr:4a-hydroxytetrahydrobiopterin dehydratase [Rickettsiales bacterium]
MLSEKKCGPCASTTPPMKVDAAQKMLQQVNGWELTLEGRAIRKRISFPDFMSALAFVQRLAPIAEAEGHHPDIMLGWGYVECVVWTHNIAGLHENDFILAAKIDQLSVA